MTDDIGDLDKIDEALMTYDLSDEALEGAARVVVGQQQPSDIALPLLALGTACPIEQRGRPRSAVRPI
jgi:hypothetical protein